MKLFTVHDSKAEAFIVPFYERTTGLAVRAFTQAANEPDHQFNKFPSDYTLFELGNFDELTAEIEMLATPKALGLAVNFIEHTTPATPIHRTEQPRGVIAGGD